ncbi:MAG: SDR family oxidoreductase [Bryobacteraceae bacterium]
MPQIIFVTGATGTIGSQVIQELAGKPGIHIRATIRDFMKAAKIGRAGVETVMFDFGRPDDYQPLLKGVDSVLLIPPFHPWGVEQAKVFIDSCKAAGVRNVVKVSVIDTCKDITVGRWHSAVDDYLKKSGMSWTILKPTSFMQNLLENSGPREDDYIHMPAGDAKTAFVDTRDIASVAALALSQRGHEGKEYTLTGPEAFTYKEVAEILSDATGRMIRYLDISHSEACQEMMDDNLPEWVIDVMMELRSWTAEGGASEVATTVSDVLGRQARNLRDFAAEYSTHWKHD